jgi:protease PrsW
VTTNLLVALAAAVPAIAVAAFLLRRGAGLRIGAGCAALAWGALVAAHAAAVVNDALAIDGPLARVLAGALVEEAFKGAGVAVVLDGLARGAGAAVGARTGALVGLGFAAVENAGYYAIAAVQGGPAGLARAVWLRGVVEGANHAAFTAATGAGVGAGRRRGTPWRSGLAALALAVAAHGLWNGVTSAALQTALCHADVAGRCAPAPDATTLVLTAPALVAVTLAPLVAAIAWMVRRDR